MAVSRYTFIGLAIGFSAFAIWCISGTANWAGKAGTAGLWLLLGLLALLAVRLLTRRINHVREATAIIPLPVLGRIDRDFSNEEAQEVLPGMHQICQNLQPWLGEPGSQLVILSADPEDGKSILASSLAINLANGGRKVTLLDTNFQNPSIYKMFGVASTPGILEHVDGTSSIGGLGYLIKKNLKVIPTAAALSSSAVFENALFKTLTEERRLASDILLYDCNATTDNADAMSLLSDKVYLIVVVRLGHTMIRSLESLASQISHKQIADGGLVIFGSETATEVSMPFAANPISVR
jgi:Mrp family chromosome partitioning ATPase